MQDFERNWPFDDPRNVAVFTTKHVIRDRKPIVYVSHEADDAAWQFHSDDALEMKEAMLVSLLTIVRHDPTVAELWDLPLGSCATRNTPADDWMRHPIT